MRKGPPMTDKELETARYHKSLLERAPDDADVARVVFKQIQDGGGTTLTKFLARTIATALLQSGSLGESVEVIEYARDNGVPLPPKLYGTVFGACSRERQHALVVRVWDAMRAADYPRMPWQYKATLLSAVYSRQEKQVFAIFDEVKANQVKDTGGEMYEHVVGVACQTEQYELVTGILEYLSASGVNSATAYQNTRRRAFKSGEYDFALELLRLMKKHGMNPTKEYKHQIMSLHKAAVHDHALRAFEAMRKAECVCDEETYGVVVESAVRLEKNRDVVESILEDMKESADLSKARTLVFPRAVRAAIWTSQHQLTLDLFDFMSEAGVDPSSDIFVSAIKTAFKLKQYDFVLDVSRKMKESGLDAKAAYYDVVVSFNKLKCYDQLLRAFNESGYDWSEPLVKIALQAAVKLDRDDEVIAICNRPCSKPSASTRWYAYALEQARAADKRAMVESILDSIKKSTSAAKKPVAD